MSENHSTPDHAGSTMDRPRRRPRPMIVLGAFLWAICLLAIVLTWYQWAVKHRAGVKTPSEAQDSDKGDQSGRSAKEIRLIPQKDGGFVTRDAADEKSDSPWDAEGIEDFEFTDTEGRPLTKKDLLGKPFVIAFVFTMCRGPCPNVTRQMRELQDVLKKFDFNLITLTVDPARDTAEVLKNYGQSAGANFDRWKFLTGNQSDIYGLIHRSFKMPVQEVEGPDRKPGFEIIHSTNLMLVDAEGRVVGKFNAEKERDVDRLKKEIRAIAKPRNDSAKTSERPLVDE